MPATEKRLRHVRKKRRSLYAGRCRQRSRQYLDFRALRDVKVTKIPPNVSTFPTMSAVIFASQFESRLWHWDEKNVKSLTKFETDTYISISAAQYFISTAETCRNKFRRWNGRLHGQLMKFLAIVLCAVMSIETETREKKSQDFPKRFTASLEGKLRENIASVVTDLRFIYVLNKCEILFQKNHISIDCYRFKITFAHIKNCSH